MVMLLKSFNTFDSLLLDTRSSRIIVRLLSGPSVIISVLVYKTILDTVGILYSVVNLIISKMRPPPDIIFSNIFILLIPKS